MEIKIQIDGEEIAIAAETPGQAITEIFGDRHSTPTVPTSRRDEILLAVAGAIDRRLLALEERSKALEDLLMEVGTKMTQPLTTPALEVPAATIEEEIFTPPPVEVPPTASVIETYKVAIPDLFPEKKVYLFGGLASDKKKLETAFRVCGFLPPRVIIVQSHQKTRVATIKGQWVVATRFINHAGEETLRGNGNRVYTTIRFDNFTQIVKQMAKDMEVTV